MASNIADRRRDNAVKLRMRDPVGSDTFHGLWASKGIQVLFN